MSKVRHGSGAVVAAAMFGLQEDIYGERPKVEIVAEADADGLDLGDMDLDLDHPEASRVVLPPEGFYRLIQRPTPQGQNSRPFEPLSDGRNEFETCFYTRGSECRDGRRIARFR